MNCPKCGAELHCPCLKCRITRQAQVATWQWIGELIKCPACGHTDHCDNWDDAALSTSGLEVER